MDTTLDWSDLLRHPVDGDHIVQTYQDPRFLAEAVAEYVGAGLRMGEAAVIIARPEHRRLFQQALGGAGDSLLLLDAEETLSLFMREGRPHWQSFHDAVGGVLSGLRLQHPGVRAYGEMVDVLWQRGERDAALQLEEFWNELARLQAFPLFCAYRMDPLDDGVYGGALESVCKAHTHYIPALDYGRLNDAVSAASKEVLDQPLAQMLLSLSATQRPATHMPLGQATLFWLKQNMPRTAERILSGVRATLQPS
ncbi:MAG: hypothetical protein QOD26_1043 [Betaproteobacteria bacterium]|jgi:hypothetical protein|nr:hypothetical protein [Betaproteobacteria bacterium]